MTEKSGFGEGDGCGGEYCILLYSEKKDGYLQNIGYLICFMDICLEHNGIGFEKILYSDAGDDKEFVLNAKYRFDQ